MPLVKTLFDNRAIISVCGTDQVSFLQGIVTQDVANLTDGTSCYGALLTPQGKLIADFFVIRHQGNLLLDCAAGIAETLLKRLKLYKLRARVDVTDATFAWRVGAIWSQDAQPVSLTPDGLASHDDPRLTSLGQRLLVAADQLAAYEHVDASPADQKAHDAHCLNLGVPFFGTGFGAEQVFPLDINFDALNGIDYRKGCFVGQEVASRMKRKGEIRKRTWIVNTDGAPLEVGQAIKAGESTIGEITAASGEKGLAMVRLDRRAKASGDATTETNVPITLLQPAYLEDVT